VPLYLYNGFKVKGFPLPHRSYKMSILDQIDKVLENAEANVLGNKYAKIEIEGNVYYAASTNASFHGQGNQHYARVDYKKNGKKIARKNI
jgi:hypothetical protein